MMTAEAAMSMVRGAMLGALFTVMVLLSAPVTSSAQGPGTSYFACRDRAWADYNDCLMDNPDSRINGFKCFVAWDLDNIGCDLRLMTMQRD